MRIAEWPSRAAMRGHRAARVNEAVGILLTRSNLPSVVSTTPPRSCRGAILFTAASDRRQAAADLFENADGKDLHFVLSLTDPDRPWQIDLFELGHRDEGLLKWHLGYRLWMRSADELAWMVPTGAGPAFSAECGQLIAHSAPPFADHSSRQRGMAMASREMLQLVNGRN